MVMATPPKRLPKYRSFRSKRKVKRSLAKYWTRVPKEKAMRMETRIPPMMARAFPVLTYWARSPNVPPRALIFTRETAKADPSNSKTSDTVVEVGNPSELKASRRMTSVIITARNRIMISEKENMSGKNTPLRATSIMPVEKVAPMRTPRAAMVKITHLGAALDPMAELRKLTASLVTPTMRSEIARAKRITTMTR